MAGVGAAGIRVIDVPALQAKFAPVSATMPDIAVNLPAVASYDLLLPSVIVRGMNDSASDTIHDRHSAVAVAAA